MQLSLAIDACPPGRTGVKSRVGGLSRPVVVRLWVEALSTPERISEILEVDDELASGARKWTQPDRLGVVDGPNVYAYARSRPVSLIDAIGTYSLNIQWSGWSAAIDYSSLHAGVSLAIEAVYRWREGGGRMPLRYVKVIGKDARGNDLYGPAKGGISWTYFEPIVDVEVACDQVRPGMAGTTKRGERGAFGIGRVVRIYPSSLSVRVPAAPGVLGVGPEAYGSTILHEWVHASLDSESDRIPDLNALRDLQVTFDIPGGGGATHTLMFKEALPHYIEWSMFPSSRGIRAH